MKSRHFSNIIIFSVISIISTSCGHKPKPFNTESIPESEKVEIKIKRYEDALFSIKMADFQNQLKKLQKDYRFFLNADLNDDINILQIHDFVNDPLIKELYSDCKKKYPDLNELEKQLSGALTCLHHYFPVKMIPRVYTYVSGLAYETPVKYNDTCLAIALDNYFGRNYKYYEQLRLPMFVTQRMEKPHIVTDCIREIAASVVPQVQPGGTLLDRMIFEGKLLYFIDLMAGNTEDSVKIAYSGEQLKWCLRNEGNIWAYLVENKLLYSTDFRTQTTFFGEGPFTSIFTKKSPARLGYWVGWQIVRNYMMKNKSMKISDFILIQDSQKILQESGYHPKK